MIVVLKPSITKEQLNHLIKSIEDLGFKTHYNKGQERSIVGIIGDERNLSKNKLEAFEGVEKVLTVLKPYKLASREFHPQDTVIEVDGVKLGGKEVIALAGPCSVESEEQLMTIAESVKKSGAKILRGSVYKPRTSPYDFQGLGDEGLKLLAKAKEETGLVVETEVMDPRKVEIVAEHVDILRVGARNFQNYDLLKELGKINKPVILKRGISGYINEWLLAAEYIMNEGNQQVILCERGIRTFEIETRNTLDLNAVPFIKGTSHLPVIVDPSHGTGKRELVIPMSKAAIAAGADGLIVEVHNKPEEALSDGKQSLTLNLFEQLMNECRPVAKAINRKM
ncbi:MAG TPA: 3-deoxy-7-phosphoheptulonate synthase [archaeon]|nr:3-deoxy-7-phosphoheptulonate synthase [archaeon]